jgi:vitamin-K-epoxide reductase (warfarin-sensitive)
MNIVVLILAGVGLVVSLYAYMMEKKIQENSSYRPSCDITNKISCSRAFNSPYSKTLGISNTIIGMAYYAFILIAELLSLSMLVSLSVIAGAIATLFLAYVLYVKVKSYCLVCTTIYIINFSLLIAVIAMRG